MRSNPRTYAVGSLIFLAGLAGAAMITTIPALFAPDEEAQAWVTATLGCAFLALAGVGTRMRRKQLSGSPEQQPSSGS